MAEREHVTQAAEQLHVAQSAVSRQIHQLEEALGIKLFLQKGRNLQLTPAGQLFHKRVEEVLKDLEHAVQKAQQFIDPEYCIDGGIICSIATQSSVVERGRDRIDAVERGCFRIVQSWLFSAAYLYGMCVLQQALSKRLGVRGGRDRKRYVGLLRPGGCQRLLPARMRVVKPAITRTIGIIYQVGEKLPLVAHTFHTFLLQHFMQPNLQQLTHSANDFT